MSTALGGFLLPDGYMGPRGLKALAREASVAEEARRFVGWWREDSRSTGPYAAHRSAAVDPVMLVPGFMAGDSTLAGMARMLRGQGFRTYRSGIRMNIGCTREQADRLERRLEAIKLKRGRKVAIVGHSLGGMMARALAARRPDLISGIVSMGSPVLAPAAVHNVLAWDAELLTRLSRAGIGGLMKVECISGPCAQESYEECRSPLDPAVGFTAIYSKRDGVVDWAACVDPLADPVEVKTSHVGMAIDPVVFAAVLEAVQSFSAKSGSA